MAVIGLDVDDVILDLVPALALYNNACFGTTHTSNDYHSYDLAEIWGCNHEEKTRRVREFYETLYHREMQPVPGAVEAVTCLSQQHEIVLVTSRPDWVRERTLNLLYEHYPRVFRDTHFLGHYDLGSPTGRTKGELCLEAGVRVFVEDALHNALDVHEYGIPVIIHDRTWNQDVLPPGMVRAKTWREIVAHIDGLLA